MEYCKKAKKLESFLIIIILFFIPAYIMQARMQKGSTTIQMQETLKKQEMAIASYYERTGDLLMRFTMAKWVLPKEVSILEKGSSFDTLREQAVKKYEEAYQLIKGKEKSLIPCKFAILHEWSKASSCEEYPELAKIINLVYTKPQKISELDPQETKEIINANLSGYYKIELLSSFLDLKGLSIEAQEIKMKAGKEALFRLGTIAFLGLVFLCLLLAGLILLIYASFKLNYIFPKIDSDKSAWSIKDGVLFIVFWITLIIIIPIAFKIFVPQLEKNTNLSWGIQVLAVIYAMQAVMFCGGIYIYLTKKGLKFSLTGFTVPNWKRVLLIGICSYIAMIPIVVGSGLLSKFFLPQEKISSNPIIPVLFSDISLTNRILLGIIIAALAPIMEELFFRGILYKTIRLAFTPKFSIPFTAFLFAILHSDPLGFLPLFSMGCLLAFIAEKSGTIVPGMIMHSLWNGGTFLVTLLIANINYLTLYASLMGLSVSLL